MRAFFALAAFVFAPLAHAQDVVLFHDDFEAGLSNWTAQTLWHIEDASQPCAAVATPFPSGTKCAWFGRDVTCTFGEPGGGWIWWDGFLTMTTPIALPANANTIRFTLRTMSQGEDDQEWDRRSMEVRVDETGNWLNLGNLLSTSTWQTAQLDLSQFAGHTVRMRLEFWAGDAAYNDFFGWFVDDVTITASSDAAVSFCTGDGQSGACPCGNAGGVGRGCASSFEPQGAQLAAAGSPNFSNDTLSIAASGISPAAVTFFAGPTRTPSGQPILFGDGMRCITGSLRRLRAFPDASGVAQIPVAGNPPLSAGFGVTASTPTLYVQGFYRNAGAFCTSSTFNLTNGLIVTWRP